MRWEEMTVRDVLILIGVFLLGFFAYWLFFAGTVHAQPVDLERTLPDLMGKSIEEIEAVLGRPDNIFTTRNSVALYYTRWRVWFVGLHFEPCAGQWILCDYSLMRRSGTRRYPLPVRP